MIVNLTLRNSSDDTAREFEFRRTRITVGAGSRNDLVVRSDREVVRLLRIDASGSGFRVTALSDNEPVAVWMPGAADARTPEPNLIVPVGTRIVIGTIEITLDGLRRPDRTQTTIVGQLGVMIAEDLVANLDAAVQTRVLRFAYAVARIENPGAFASELASHLLAESEAFASVQLVLPGGYDDPWDRVICHGDDAVRFPLESLSVAGTELYADLCRAQVIACERDGVKTLLVPVGSESRLHALISVGIEGTASEVLQQSLDALRAVRPFVLSFATRNAGMSEREALAEENRYFHERQRRHYLFKELVTDSVAMRRVHRALGTMVAGDVPVLLYGEAGTGKELLARALHHLGGRASGMMIAQHCGALDESQLDFQLFGYIRDGEGGGSASSRGIFELANGGTVFLDEIHALSPRLQLKLHRMLVEGEVFRIGESIARSVDVRVVAATHRDLMALVEQGLFRRDLALLLAKQTLTVPALRDRREDVSALIETFCTQYGRRYNKPIEGVEPETYNWLVKLKWPGNVRELQSVIERAVLAAADDQKVLTRAEFDLQ